MPLVWLGVYVAAMALGRLVVLESTQLALFWPAAGVAALWMLRGRTLRQVVVDGGLLFTGTTLFFVLFVDSRVLTSVLLGTANLAQALVVRAVLALLDGRSIRGRPRRVVTSAQDMRALLVAATAAALVGAPVGTLAAWAQTGDLDWPTAASWAIRNLCGILVPSLAVLTITGARDPRRARSWRESLTSSPRAGAGLELAVAVLVTFGAGAVVIAAPQQIPIAFVVVVTSTWIGFRFAPTVGAVCSLVFGILAVVLTLEDLGPFGVVEDLALRASVVQLFVTTTALLVLLVAFGVSEQTALAARLREAEALATGRAELLDAVNGAIVDGVCVSDSWGHVLLANSAAAELGGADAQGVHVHEASDAEFYWPDGTRIRPDDLPHARALNGEVVPLSDVVRRDRATGHEMVLAVSAVPLHFAWTGADDPAAARPLAVVLMRDVTRQRAQQRALENFVAVVAHDLKGPLAGVLSWAEMATDQLEAEDEPQVPAALGSIDRIHRTAGRMNLLITDLLDFAVAGSADLQVTRVDLDALVDSIVGDLERPEESGLVTRSDLGDVVADALLTRQLFSNLIANAVKFVAPGVRPHITIESRVVGDMREIRVSDNGVGIPDRDRGRVFDSFFRSSASGQFPGSGLGLAICLRAVDRHGGTIAAQEGPGGRGTTMVFTLPMQAAGATPAPLTHRAADPVVRPEGPDPHPGAPTSLPV